MAPTTLQVLRMQYLTTQNGFFIYGIEEKGFIWEPNNKTLTNIDLSYCESITHLDLKCLPSNLRSLKLSGCAKIFSGNLPPLPDTLQKVWLMYTSVTDADLLVLPRGLTYLNLTGCAEITSKGMKNLPPNLTVCNIPTPPSQPIPTPNLSFHQHLYLAGCANIDDESVLAVPRSLQELDVRTCPRVTKASIKELIQYCTVYR